jgi:hypothetical protein
MDTNRFWMLIDRARDQAGTDVDGYGPALEQTIVSLEPADLIAFEQHFDSCIDRAWRWDLWGAAHVVNGGCSDDGFFYFRGWLVMQGRQVYEAALANPDGLADVCTDAGEVYECEDVLYVARSLYEARMGEEMPVRSAGGAPTPEPAGRQWAEDDLAALLPRLTALHWAQDQG